MSNAKKIPTDLQILEAIYNDYYETFITFNKENPSRRTKIYVPIDIDNIANHFKVDVDIIFGRLYYHLNRKYRYEQPNGSKVSFFSLDIDESRRSVQFPMLSSILADLKDQQQKHLIATWISIAAIFISIISLIISIFLL